MCTSFCSLKQLGVLILPLFRRQVYGWLYFAKFPSNFLKNLTREMHCENRQSCEKLTTWYSPFTATGIPSTKDNGLPSAYRLVDAAAIWSNSNEKRLLIHWYVQNCKITWYEILPSKFHLCHAGQWLSIWGSVFLCH